MKNLKKDLIFSKQVENDILEVVRHQI